MHRYTHTCSLVISDTHCSHTPTLSHYHYTTLWTCSHMLHTSTHTLSLTHMLTHPHSLSHTCFTHTHSLSHTCSHTLSLTHTCSHAHASLIHSHTVLTHLLSHTHMLTPHACKCSLIHSHTYTHTYISLTHMHTLSLSHIHTCTHTHTYMLTHSWYTHTSTIRTFPNSVRTFSMSSIEPTVRVWGILLDSVPVWWSLWAK